MGVILHLCSVNRNRDVLIEIAFIDLFGTILYKNVWKVQYVSSMHYYLIHICIRSDSGVWVGNTVISLIYT